MFCLYITIHIPTGKFYLGKGQTIFVKGGKYRGSGAKLIPLLKTTSKEEWKTTILLTEPDEVRCYELEAQLIDDRTLRDQRCLNLKRGGAGWRTGPQNKETVLKRANSQRGQILTEEHKAKISKTLSGKPITMEHRVNISKGQTGRKQSPEWNAAIKAGWVLRKEKAALAKLTSPLTRG